MLVYDLEGKEHDKEPVDCRELVNGCGWTYELKATEVAEVPAPEVAAKRGRPANG